MVNFDLSFSLAKEVVGFFISPGKVFTELGIVTVFWFVLRRKIINV